MSDTETDKPQDQPQDQSGEEQPRYHVELVEQILIKLEEFFSAHLDAVFKEADDYLFHAADQAQSTAEQNGLFECMNAVRSTQSVIKQSFVNELGMYLQPVAELEELPEKKAQKKQVLSLGLVEQNEMDEIVMLSSISSKAAMNNSEAISDLIRRLDELATYNDHIFHGAALEPKRLCDAMHNAVSDTDLIDDNKLVVYRFFNEALIKDLSSLYETLNNLLIENGIMPEIDYSASYVFPQGVPQHEEPAEEEPEMPVSDMPPAGPSGRRSFGSGMPGYAPANTGMALSMPAGATGAPQPAGPRRAFGSGMPGYQAPHQAPLPGQSAPQTGPSGQAYSAGIPVGQVRQSIENFVGGSYADVSLQGDDSHYSQQQVMTALTHLQSPRGDLRQTPLVFDANQIKKAVLSSIGESDGGAVTKSVHQVSEKTIDFIKLIFDAIIEEDSITDEIKTLLLSLQIPVIKAAMLDSEFFVDDQHPARQLLDKIAEAGVGVSEHTDPVYVDIEQIVRKLLKDYDDDVVAFTVALDELKALTEEIYRKARQVEAESQKAVKLSHAKSIVLQEIRKVTLGKELPEGVRTLVLKIWPSMMFNHYLKHGKANDEWVELLMILQKIIESVQPISSLSALEELGLTHHDIVEAARNKLQRCKKKQAVLDQAMLDLQGTYDALMATELSAEPEVDASVTQDAAAGSMAGSDEEELELGQAEALQAPEPEPEISAEELASQKIGKLPEGVSPGAWFIVYNGEDKPVRRLKLAVILMQDATMVFVDHLGNVVIEKDAEKFADEIEKGLSGIIMQHSVFDHALSNALGSIGR